MSILELIYKCTSVRSKRYAASFLLIIIHVAFFSVPAYGGPILYDPETWDSGTSGWTNEAPEGTGDASLSNPDGYLKITFPSQAGEPEYEEDTIYTKQAGETGNFAQFGNNLILSFRFYAEDVLPLSTVLYLHSSSSGNIWEYAFANTAVGVWTRHEIAFIYDKGWAGPGGAGTFRNDLSTIDWIGINIARKLDTIQQDYGLDDWVYFIPEPGAMCMLASTFVSLMFALRKKLRIFSVFLKS